jgi:hypothetical protein
MGDEETITIAVDPANPDLGNMTVTLREAVCHYAACIDLYLERIRVLENYVNGSPHLGAQAAAHMMEQLTARELQSRASSCAGQLPNEDAVNG